MGCSGKGTLFLTGYARLPAGITASELSRVVGIGLEVEPEAGRIVEADCTLATRLARRFFRELVVGFRLVEDLDELVKRLEERYHGNAQKALVAALRLAAERYRGREEE